MLNNAKNALDNFIHWILTSSANPAEVSLTIKAAAVGIVPVIMALAGVAHLNLGDGSVLTTLFDAFATFFQNVLTVVASGMAVYGICRKIWYLVFPPKIV